MKTYLNSFTFLGEKKENEFLYPQWMTCYNNYYPFGVLPQDFTKMTFAPITVLYGGNGSGKSTMLNIIAEKLEIQRSVIFNKSSFFDDYVNLCRFEMESTTQKGKILTSDDVFKRLFLLREKNEIIDTKREETMLKRAKLRGNPGGDSLKNQLGDVNFLEKTDELGEICDAWSDNISMSVFVKSRVEKNLIGKSNGETALDFFVNEISDEGIYLLDEPENSLSANFQIDLAEYLGNAARFFGAQLIIATHSPFLLSIPNAKIYNLDTRPISTPRNWTELFNMRIYYEFFKQHANEFEN